MSEDEYTVNKRNQFKMKALSFSSMLALMCIPCFSHMRAEMQGISVCYFNMTQIVPMITFVWLWRNPLIEQCTGIASRIVYFIPHEVFLAWYYLCYTHPYEGVYRVLIVAAIGISMAIFTNGDTEDGNKPFSELMVASVTVSYLLPSILALAYIL